jgi:type IV pilus assembly protein PilM
VSSSSSPASLPAASAAGSHTPSFQKALAPLSDLFKRLTTVKAKEPKVTVGLDIGSTAVKMLALGPRKGSAARAILGHQIVPVGAGGETDPTAAIKTAMAGLKETVKTVNLAVSGQWVIMRIIEMPVMKPAELKQALPYEAQRYLPFSIQDVIVDGVALGLIDANKTWVLIVACKKELLERRIDWVKRAGYDVTLIDVDALALANGFLAGGNGAKTDSTRSLINVGAQLTNLVIFKGNTPYLVRDIPWGSEKLTRSIAEQRGVEPSVVAQELLASEPSAELRGTIKIAAEALITELQLSFDYFENRFGQPPEEILVCGGLAQSAAFLEALKGLLTQAVNPWAPKGVSSQFAVAYGLALRTS